MYCKRCGMDSANEEVCEWCNQPMMRVEGPLPPEEVDPMAADRPLPPLPPRMRVKARAVSTVPTSLRFGVSLAVGLVLGICSLMIVYVVAKQAPQAVSMSFLSVRLVEEASDYGATAPAGSATLVTAIKGGIFTGLLLGVLLGILLSLTHWGPILGVLLGAALGWITLSQAGPGFPGYVGPVVGAVAGLIIGLIGQWGYRKPLSV